MSKFPPRHAISRARFFLQKAEECSAEQRNDFEACLEASIVFARAALGRLQPEYRKHPNWEKWWQALLLNTSVSFFRHERDWILHDGPPKVGQVIRLGQLPVPASDLYYYDSPDVRATDTVRRHLDEVEKLVVEAEQNFKT